MNLSHSTTFHTFAIHPQHHVFSHCHQATTVDCRWLCCTVRPWHRIETLKRRCNRIKHRRNSAWKLALPRDPQKSPSWSCSVKGAIYAIPSISKENIDPKPFENNPQFSKALCCVMPSIPPRAPAMGHQPPKTSRP